MILKIDGERRGPERWINPAAPAERTAAGLDQGNSLICKYKMAKKSVIF
jgi:hypothetical protein